MWNNQNGVLILYIQHSQPKQPKMQTWIKWEKVNKLGGAWTQDPLLYYHVKQYEITIYLQSLSYRRMLF